MFKVTILANFDRKSRFEVTIYDMHISVCVCVCVCVCKQTCISLCVPISVCHCHCTSVYLCVCMCECLCMCKSVVCQISLACIPKSAKCKNRSNGPVLLGLEEGWGWVGAGRGRDG